MSHMIDNTTGHNAIAYRGETPWHGLGQAIDTDEGIDVWAAKAGLSHTVLSAPVEFSTTSTAHQPDAHVTQEAPRRRVLYRSDTHAALSVVSSGYRIVQPKAVLGFFESLCRHNRFQLETAGALDDGKRVWALAKVNDGASVVGYDELRPYVLLATSYDGSMATTARLTSVRVVCHNTLSMAVPNRSTRAGASQGVINVTHSSTFDADAAKLDLGLVGNAFDHMLRDARLLARHQLTHSEAEKVLAKIMPQPMTTDRYGARTPSAKPVEQTKGFRSVMELFAGEGMGQGLRGSEGTAWGLLNAVTQHVDWQSGRSDNNRLRSAWFGAGDELKTKALQTLLANT